MNVKEVGRRAVIGRGFVGMNLWVTEKFTHLYWRDTLKQMHGHYNLIVIAAPSAEKWKINGSEQEAENDRKNIRTILRTIESLSYDRLVLISSIDAGQDHSYGRNRALFEKWTVEIEENVTILRLPALFGKGLKKNLLYDMLTGNSLIIHPSDVYQWYNIDRLWGDIESHGPGLFRLYSAPLSVRAMVEMFPDFGLREVVYMTSPTTIYSEYSDIDYPLGTMLKEMSQFVDEWRKQHAVHYPQA